MLCMPSRMALADAVLAAKVPAKVMGRTRLSDVMMHNCIVRMPMRHGLLSYCIYKTPLSR